MTENTVELRNVSKHFDDVVAVNNVSLDIKDGEFFSLLGPSGCGKTTTLRMIGGLEIPTEGEVYIHGQPMGLTPPFQRSVNIVFQNYALFPHMSVFKNIAFGLEMKKVPRSEIERRVAEALEMVRLPGMGDRKPKQLSGGQQQRVALARALVNRPEVLLLDEPLGALDLKLRKEMQIELKNLQQQVGITFIYVTHDQEEALSMSDRIAVMDQGRILQVGEAADIYERPNCRFVADFIGESNFLIGSVKGIGPEVVTVLVDGALLVRAGRDRPLEQSRSLTVAVRPEKIQLHSRPVEEAANVFSGTVETVVYIGTDTQYQVRLTDNVVVKVREQNLNSSLARTIYAEGDRVYVTWQSESVLLLSD